MVVIQSGMMMMMKVHGEMMEADIVSLVVLQRYAQDLFGELYQGFEIPR